MPSSHVLFSIPIFLLFRHCVPDLHIILGEIDPWVDKFQMEIHCCTYEQTQGDGATITTKH